MAILGLTRQGDTFRFVLCDYAKGALAAQKFGEVQAASWSDAIASLAAQTGARQLALAIEPPGLSIQEVDVSNLSKDTEKRGAARNKAILAGFDDRDDIRVRTDDDGNWYFAALRADLKREIYRAAAQAKMQIIRIENAAYSWVRFLDPRFNALVDASTENRVAVLVVGDRRAELRVFDRDRKTLLDDIEKTFDAAVQHGFARTVQVAAVIDPSRTLDAAAIGKTQLEPYSGVIPGTNAGFVVPLGVVFAAAGGALPGNLLDVDFAEREQFNIGERIAPIVSRLPQGDVLAIGAIVGVMLLLSLVQWVRGTQFSMQAATLQTQLIQRKSQADAIRSEATVVAREAKRVADAYAARQSGGVAARRLAHWMGGLPHGVTLESVTYDGVSGDVSVTGDSVQQVAAEGAYQVINQPSSKFTQTGNTFTIERETGAQTASPTPQPIANGLSQAGTSITTAPNAPRSGAPIAPSAAASAASAPQQAGTQ